MMGISGPCIWDIETDEDEIGSNYSVADVQRFCRVLGIQPRYLFGFEMVSPPLSSNEMAALVRQHCRSRGITTEQFEEAAGWSVVKSLDDPERFRHDYPIDGIMNICRELEVDWHRFMESQ